MNIDERRESTGTPDAGETPCGRPPGEAGRSPERILNILFAGIGGQGVLTASQLLSEAAVRAGHDVKKSEVHGMAQRGGVVTSHVRIGRKVYSPIISTREVDLLVAFEEAEALRWRPELRQGGTLIVNCLRIAPPVVNLGLFPYPDDPLAGLRDLDGSLLPIEASALAIEAGSPRLAGTILIGAAAAVLPLSVEHWEAAIRHRFTAPGILEQNLKAFHRGRECSRSQQIGPLIPAFSPTLGGEGKDEGERE